MNIITITTNIKTILNLSINFIFLTFKNSLNHALQTESNIKSLEFTGKNW